MSQTGPLYDMLPPAYRKRPTLPTSFTSEELVRMRSEAVGVRLRQALSNCRPTCPCAWSQIIRLQLAYRTNFGPSFQLSTLRRSPDSAQSVSFALNGNIDGRKRPPSQGLASPRGVSSARGYGYSTHIGVSYGNALGITTSLFWVFSAIGFLAL